MMPRPRHASNTGEPLLDELYSLTISSVPSAGIVQPTGERIPSTRSLLSRL